MTMTERAQPAAGEMRGYRYKHGDRPLDGYTIQRAAGRGGFGEVYYAVSDGGREVALKVVQAFEDVELRGIGQCMNLKSPHLVTIFDVREGNDGQPIVIMEYVAGPSLRDLLDDAPSGMGTQKAAFFLREIGKGLTYLHDCGIVHRDLKPANIFYENGYVKIGDYGLSKAITASHRSGQTMTVGTVHYMAPEVGAGRYDRSIDIYALGALLYEMLTGQPPFYGASAAEVLMKHLGTPVDVGALPEPFATVVRRAMAKDPNERYSTVQEMVEAVFGAEHVRQSVSSFSPDSLSLVAGRVADRAANRLQGGPPPRPMSSRAYEPPTAADRVRERVERLRGRVQKRCAPWVGWWTPNRPAWPATPPGGAERSDPVASKHRCFLAFLISALLAVAGAMLAAQQHDRFGRSPNPAPMIFTVLVSIYGGAIGLSRVSDRLMPALREESRILRHLALGAGACMGLLITFFLWGHDWRASFSPLPSCGAIAVSAMLLNWEERMRPDRRERLVPAHLFTAAAVSLIVGLVFDAEVPLVIATVCGISLAVSIRSPWLPPSARPVVPPPVLAPTPAATDPFTGRPVSAVAFTTKETREADMLSVTHPLATPPSMSSAPMTDAPRRRSWGIFRLIRALVRLPFFIAAMALLLAAFAAAIYLATDVPGLLASGRLDPRIPHDMAQAFNTNGWPNIMRAIGGAALFVTASLSCVFHLLLRRRRGPVHMIRALGAIGLLLLVPFVAMRAGVPWGGPNVVAFGREDWWQVLQSGFSAVRPHDLFLAACLFATSALLMLWPAQPPRRQIAAPAEAVDPVAPPKA